MLEKQRRNNTYVMLIGLIMATLGIFLLLWIRWLGIAMLIAGVVVLSLSWSVSNLFFSLDLKNDTDGKNKGK